MLVMTRSDARARCKIQETVFFHVFASKARQSRNRDEVRTFGALRSEVVRYAHFEVIKMQEPDARKKTGMRHAPSVLEA